MNLIKDPTVRRITFKKSSRVGFTKACVNIPMGYFMHCDPRSMLVLLPTEKSAEKFSKVELAPMLRDVPVLRGLVVDKTRDSNSTILEKHYPGGIAHIGGANSSRVFRQLTVSIGFCDETSDYPPSAGGEGNQLKLTERRMGDAWNRLLIEGSSPKLKGACSITDSYEQSDKRRYLVPCPHCDHGQFLEFGGKEFDHGIKWPSGRPEEAHYLCEHCHCVIEERSKRWMVTEGHYTATNQKGKWPGFHIWAAYSFLPDAAWGVIASEFLEAGHDPMKLQVFENTVKGEAFEEIGRAPSEEKLADRREPYALRETGRILPDGNPETMAMVPKGVGVIGSGTDVHPNRLETQVVGFGLGEEAWVLEYHVLYGDPTALLVWEEYWKLLLRPRYMERGGVDYIRSSCIDSQYAAQAVAAFVAEKPVYRTPDGLRSFLWAVRGDSGKGEVWPRKPGKFKGPVKAPVYTIKVDAAKDALYGRADSVEEHGPGYFHVPDILDEEYFRQFTSEHAVTTYDSRGFEVRAYEMKKGRKRNEALDTAVYAYASLCALYTMGLDLAAECSKATVFWPPDIEPPQRSQPNQSAPPPGGVPRPGRRRPRQKGTSSYLGG